MACLRRGDWMWAMMERPDRSMVAIPLASCAVNPSSKLLESVIYSYDIDICTWCQVDVL